MTTMLNNSPNINNIKNDFSIWGKKKANSEGKENAIHLRCAIDEKPDKYVSFDNVVYTSNNNNRFSSSGYDWRELIY